MLVEEYIEQIRPLVVEMFKEDSSGHDLWYLERTKNLALCIQEKEGGDRIVIGLAAFLHDIHRIMQNETGSFVEPKESIPAVKKILEKTDLDEGTINKICFAIENHELYNWNGNNVNDINTLVVQDADNLEAIGAIGIGRCFNYGGSRKLEMYNPDIPLNEKMDYAEESGDDPTSLHHFYHKLFKLKDYMNTDTARKIAQERTDFMHKFVDEFLDEWNGKK